MSKQKVTIASRIASDAVERSILVIRGQKVLVDEQLAAFYNVPTKALVQAVKRNPGRFSPDFMFQLSKEEWAAFTSNDNVMTDGDHKNRRSRRPPAAGGRRSEIRNDAAHRMFPPSTIHHPLSAL
jgi:hypothetical protein